MQYRKYGKTGEMVSALSLGMMRLPTASEEGNSKDIDQAATNEMVKLALEKGINYFDTAYPYHGGQSEVALGIALRESGLPRPFIASKSPVWLIEKEEDFDRYLDEQLERLGVDYIDFYLLHALDADRWENKVQKFNLCAKMEQARAAGKIRHIGFSFHDKLEAFKQIIDGYEGWEFCQIQLNYIDTNYQAGIEGLKYAAQRGLGVAIMEPLLGGRLATPPKDIGEALGGKDPVQAALDSLWDMPEVGVVLSGMSNLEQLRQNIGFAEASSVGKLSQEERGIMAKAKQIYDAKALVPCTRCAYCMPCPAGLNIPSLINKYNNTAIYDFEEVRKNYMDTEVKADACIGCHACEAECPQHLKPSELMPKIHALFTK